MRRGPEAEARLRAFSCHRCSCWLRCWGFCWLCHRCSGCRRARPPAGSTAGVSAGCATGVPGAVGPARSPVLLPVCLLAVPPVFLLAAEQVFLLAALLVFLLAVPPVFRAPSGPPARSPSAPRASLGASVRSPARPCGPAGALHSGGSWCALIGQAHFTCSPRTPQLLGTQPISHAIPLSTFHVLKDERWNCNVFCLG